MRKQAENRPSSPKVKKSRFVVGSEEDSGSGSDSIANHRPVVENEQKAKEAVSQLSDDEDAGSGSGSECVTPTPASVARGRSRRDRALELAESSRKAEEAELAGYRI